MPSHNLTDEEFDKLLEEKRHEEFMSTMTALLKSLRGIDNTELELVISKLSNKLDTVARPEINVDFKGLISAINDLKTVLTIKKDEESIAQWTFTIKRDSRGYIESVDALKL